VRASQKATHGVIPWVRSVQNRHRKQSGFPEHGNRDLVVTARGHLGVISGCKTVAMAVQYCEGATDL
jgi:hypothetical protein